MKKWKPLRIPSWTKASAIFHKPRPKSSLDGGRFGPVWHSVKSVVEGDDQLYVIFRNHNEDSVEFKYL